MKLEIVKDKLLDAVSICERVAGKHVSLPVLSCVFLEAKKNELTIRATNLDVGVEISLPCKTSNEGAVAISGSVLKAYLSNTSNEKSVLIEVDGTEMRVSSPHNKAVIKTLNHEDFPAIPKIDEGKSFSINCKEFVKGVTSVWYSSSMSSIKPELSSVYVYPDNEDLVFVATDSFRLAEKKIKSKKTKDITSILIPFKNVTEIARVLDSVEGDVKVVYTKNQISFFVPGVHITSRVIEGNFPDYKQIIPKEFVASATVLKQDFLQALKLTGVFSDTFNQVSVTVSPTEKSLEVKTRNNDVGEGAQQIKGFVSGQDLSVNFNHKYLFDCLQSIEDESLLMQFGGHGKPLVVSPARNGGFMYLIMPMNR